MYSGGKISNILWKIFHRCFSKIKCLPTIAEEDENFVPNNSNKNPSSENFDYFHNPTTNSASKSSTLTSHFNYSDSDSDSIPNLSTILKSQRFFFSTPGRSNSIFESPGALPGCPDDGLVSGGVAIQTYSADPFADFRRSMQEMVEARELTDVKANWEMLHELLLCYIKLNPKHTHKFIVDAFADLVISLMSSSTAATI